MQAQALSPAPETGADVVQSDDAMAAIETPTDVASEPADTVVEAAEIAVAETPEPPMITVPKGHLILISVEGQVGSKISTAKEFFPIKLAQPVIVDGVEVLPAGITGEGQVVHAKKGGFAGSAGELILAARYLMHGDRRINLRSFKWIEEGDELPFKGKDNTDLVIATNAVLGPLGFLIGGGNTTIEPGTLATAKFRAEELFEIESEITTKPADTGSGEE